MPLNKSAVQRQRTQHRNIPLTQGMCRFPWSPIDALIKLAIRCRLFHQVSILPDLTAVAKDRTTTPHSGGRRRAMRGGSDSTPACSRMWRISTLGIMKAMMRICPPHSGHKGGNTSVPTRS